MTNKALNMVAEKINFIFWGTDEFSVTVLEELKKAGFIPALVVTAPDKRQGRGMKLTPPPAKVWAEKNSIKFLQPQKLDSDFSFQLSAFNSGRTGFQLFVVASYGKILPKEILDIPKHGTLNIHPSLLPLFRGPSPIQSQILKNTRMVGVTIMLMDEKIDHGPIVAQGAVPMSDPLPSTPELETVLARAGGKLLAKTIPGWIAGNIDKQEQNHKASTYTKQIKKEDGLVDIEKEDPEMLYRKFRAYDPWPGIYFFQNGKRIKITNAKFENREFVVKGVIPEGKQEMSYLDFKS